MNLRLYTIEYKNGYVGATVYNWTTKKDILNHWRELGHPENYKIVTKLFPLFDFITERGGIRQAFLMNAAIERIEKITGAKP
jgi:hypothetical protein